MVIGRLLSMGSAQIQDPALAQKTARISSRLAELVLGSPAAKPTDRDERTAQDPAVAVLKPLGQVGTFAPGDLEPLFDAPLRAGRNRRPVAVTGEDRKGDEDDRTKNSTDEMHVTYPKDTCSFGSMPRQ
jgi:hypothetical protein